jgi:hypothetical protein
LDGAVVSIRPWLASGVLALSVLTGCANRAAGSAPGTCGAAPFVEPGDTTTIVYGGALSFVVTGSAALPGGDVLVAVETNVPEAGDEATDPRPETFVIGADGECVPFELPVVEGTAVGGTAVPVAAGDDDSLFLWDPDNHRIVGRDASGTWRTAVTIPSRLVMYGTPDAAVAQDGTLYVQTDASIHRVVAGELELVAGTEERLRQGHDPGPFPRPATSKPLPLLTGIDASADGELFLAMQSGILAVDAGGTLRLLADDATTRGQEGAIVGHEAGPVNRSRLLGIAVTEDGDLLVGDPGRDRVLQLSHGRSSILTEEARALSFGEPLDPTGRMLLAKNTRGDLVVVGLDD